MAKDLNITVLYDFYGDMLTEKQQEVVELYYNEDLSLAEIASHIGITRQGVRDSIKRAEFQLNEFEELLGLAEKFKLVEQTLSDILDQTKSIDLINQKRFYSEEITDHTNKIIGLIAKLDQI